MQGIVYLLRCPAFLLEKMIDEISNIDIEKATEDILNNDYIIIENKKIQINSFNRK